MIQTVYEWANLGRREIYVGLAASFPRQWNSDEREVFFRELESFSNDQEALPFIKEFKWAVSTLGWKVLPEVIAKSSAVT